MWQLSEAGFAPCSVISFVSDEIPMPTVVCSIRRGFLFAHRTLSRFTGLVRMFQRSFNGLQPMHLARVPMAIDSAQHRKDSIACNLASSVASHAGSCHPSATLDVLLGDALTGGSLSSMDLPKLAREVSRAHKRVMMLAAHAIEDSIDSRRAGTLESQEVFFPIFADGSKDAKERFPRQVHEQQEPVPVSFQHGLKRRQRIHQILNDLA